MMDVFIKTLGKKLALNLSVLHFDTVFSCNNVRGLQRLKHFLDKLVLLVSGLHQVSGFPVYL